MKKVLIINGAARIGGNTDKIVQKIIDGAINVNITPDLERVFEGSLSKANRILRIIGFHNHDLNMVPRQTVYHQWGNGKNRILRFSKSGDPNLEKAYSRHYIWNQSQEKKLKVINEAIARTRRCS